MKKKQTLTALKTRILKLAKSTKSINVTIDELDKMDRKTLLTLLGDIDAGYRAAKRGKR